MLQANSQLFECSKKYIHLLNRKTYSKKYEYKTQLVLSNLNVASQFSNGCLKIVMLNHVENIIVKLVSYRKNVERLLVKLIKLFFTVSVSQPLVIVAAAWMKTFYNTFF